MSSFVAPPTDAQVVDTTLWGTNGRVSAVVREGNTIYIGGLFTQVGPALGGGVPLDRETGAPVGPFPRVAGYVLAVAPDGAGGWYIGGSFIAVGGVPRSNLAHVLSGGSVAPWDPAANGSVSALEVSGNTVYVGGQFDSVGGQARVAIAALDAATGNATAWNPGSAGTSAFVNALVVRGSTVYVGGSFTQMGGLPRNRIAALDAASGAATDWNPNANNQVFALAASGDTIYVGGSFTYVGGQTRYRVAALDATTGLATGWAPVANNWVYALAVSGGTVYLGGQFTYAGGQTRNHIAALDAATGVATDWDPNADLVVYGLAVSEDVIYAAGGFNTVGGEVRHCLAAVARTTGEATGWDPNAGARTVGQGGHALALSGDRVYAGGNFSCIGGQARSRLAALDATTGAVTAWNPVVSGSSMPQVLALAVGGGRVYVGGAFTGVNGSPRSCIAAVDAVTGAVEPWDPSAVGASVYVKALAVSGSVIYVGGSFTSIGGQSRNCIAALDAVTGAATPWDPNADALVRALAVSGGTVYAGGDFLNVGGQPRRGIAALEAGTGIATAWDPDATSYPEFRTLLMNGGTLYAGGYFQGIGADVRRNLVELDLTSGAATAWAPDANSTVLALAVNEGTVYAGGTFTTIGGQERKCLAALDPVTGAATEWNPAPSGLVEALTASGGTVYVGGDFIWMDGQPRAFLAAFAVATLDVPGIPEAQGPTLAPCAPNPARSRTLIRFTLPSAGPVSLTVFDLQGRMVTRVLDGALRPAGAHEAVVNTDGWPAGCYFSRLEADGARLTRKLVVLE